MALMGLASSSFVPGIIYRGELCEDVSPVLRSRFSYLYPRLRVSHSIETEREARSVPLPRSAFHPFPLHLVVRRISLGRIHGNLSME